MYSEVITNVWLMARMLGKVALYTGIGPATIALIFWEAYMRITLESTSKIVEIVDLEHTTPVQARVWEGTTGSGIRVIALIPRIAVKNGQDTAEFEAELKEQRPPSREAVEAFPLRMIL
jgi:hypothetical protein